LQKKQVYFHQVAGHTSIKERLIQSVRDNRVSHAQLFIGPEGSGNLALALAYAQYVNCQAPGPHDACGECPSCHKYDKLGHPDLTFIFPVARTEDVDSKPKSSDFMKEWRSVILDKKGYLALNEWYQAIGIEKKQGLISVHDASEILKALSYKSYDAHYQTVLIWLPEKMNTQAANKILKILEEPPEGSLFLLVSENLEPILPTVLSRTQIIRVPRISDADLQTALEKHTEADAGKIREAVRFAEGSYIAARNLLQDSEQESDLSGTFRDWMLACYFYTPGQAKGEKFQDVLKISTELGQMIRERQKYFLLHSLNIIRETFIMHQNLPDNESNNKQGQDFIAKFRNFLPPDRAIGMASELDKAIYHIERNAHGGILFLDLSLKFCKALVRVKS
jgi:DNA polymerase-3 subunit delta'